MSRNADSELFDGIPYVKAGADLRDLTSNPDFRGQVEIVRDGEVSGWCVSTVDPMRPVALELWLGDAKLSAFATSYARPDIEALIGLPVPAGFSALFHSFYSPVSEILDLIAKAREAGETPEEMLSVRVAGHPVELESTPNLQLSFEQLAIWVARSIVVTPGLNAADGGPSHRGFVEAMVEGVMTGWCLDIARPNATIPLEVYYGDLLLGVATTSEVRNDINALLRSTATSGFRFRPDDIGAAHVSEVLSTLSKAIAGGQIDRREFKVRIAGTNLYLPFSNSFSVVHADLLRYCEAANALLAEIAGNNKLGVLRDVMETSRTHAPQGREVLAGTRDPQDVAIVAFYLPQFHPFAENDDWWGTGFTEWTNVTAAKPSFKDHNQPRVPADLGYYDLRLDAIQEQQIALARKYKVSAFCYYYYSFAGKTLMTLPIERHFEKDYPLDFCLCWANENWSRRWDGSEDDVLMRQSHSEADDEAFIDQIVKYFESPRYIKIDGAPLLLVYRIGLLSNPAATIASWKRKVVAAGFRDLHVCVCETFGLTSPVPFAADSSCQFPPHTALAKEIQGKTPDLDKDFSGKVYDYVETAANEIWRPDAPFLQFRTAMPSWDNTSRKGRAAHVFHNASPATFEAWLSVLCAKARRDQPPGRRLVFVNAWNEWAEGAYLEPDRRDGHRNLKAVRAAQSAANLLMGDALAAALRDEGASADVVRLVSSLANANSRLMDFVNDYGAGAGATASPFVAIDKGVFRQEIAAPASCNIESVNGRLVDSVEITVDPLRKVALSGWVRVPGVSLTASLPVFMKLAAAHGQDYVASLHGRFARSDVVAAFDDKGEQHHGFNGVFDLRDVPQGIYRLQVLIGSIHQANAVYLAPTAVTFILG